MKKRLLYGLLAICLTICCLTLAGCGKSKNSYSIVVQSLHYNLGSVEGGNKTYFEGEEVTIVATPTTTSGSETPNSEFICWLLNNKVITTKNEYTFTVSKETAGNYLALFTCPYLEYFSLDNLTLNSGIDAEVNTNTMVKKLVVSAGTVESLLTPIYTSETLPSGTSFELFNTDVYATDAFPFAYDMQENIYLNIEVTYEQDGVTFVSNTNTKIDAVNNVTIDTLSALNVTLNTAKDPTNEDLTINLANASTISLNFKRLSTFTLPQEEEPTE